MKIYFIICTLLIPLYSFSQSPETLDKIEAAKIALITERLDLSPEQAEKFWPIYREMEQKQLQLRDEFKQLRQGYNPEKASEEENKQMLERGIKIKERQLDLEKSYAQRFQQVITTRQLMNLRKAEDDFREMLMRRIRQQQRNRDQIRDNRLRNNDNIERRKN